MRFAAALMLLISTVMLQLQAQQTMIEAEMKPPVVVHKTEPAYTEDARKAKVEGAVVLRANIGADGRPHDIRVIKRLGYGLDDSAVECLSQWLYRPGTANGAPITVP